MSPNPTILYVVGGFSVGGTENHLSQVLPILKRRGWALSVLRLGDDGPMSRPLVGADIDIIPVVGRAWPPVPKLRGVGTLLSQVKTCASIVHRAKPDILHTFLGWPSIVGGFAHILSRGSRLVVSKRNQMARPDAFLGDSMLERWALRRATMVLAHSSVVRDELVAADVAPSRITLIQSGIDLARYNTAWQRRTSIKAALGWGGDTVILMLANLIPYKGHTDVIQALAGLPREDNQGNSWRAVFVGGGDAEYDRQLKELARAKGISGRIEFLGERSDVPDLLAAADIGLLASHHEGFANAILEYMAAGLCIVATAVGGNFDVIQDGVTGYFCPAGNSIAMAKILRWVLDNPALRTEVAHRATALVRDRFSLEGCVDKYEMVYRRLFADTRKG